MLVLYDSKTGNVRRFIGKTAFRSAQIEERMEVDEPFVLVTYTTGFGQAPERVMAFLERNHLFLRGVAASGNRNWGTGYARSADRISAAFGVPVLAKFELSGTNRDVEHFMKGVNGIAPY